METRNLKTTKMKKKKREIEYEKPYRGPFSLVNATEIASGFLKMPQIADTKIRKIPKKEKYQVYVLFYEDVEY